MPEYRASPRPCTFHLYPGFLFFARTGRRGSQALGLLIEWSAWVLSALQRGPCRHLSLLENVIKNTRPGPLPSQRPKWTSCGPGRRRWIQALPQHAKRALFQLSAAMGATASCAIGWNKGPLVSRRCVCAFVCACVERLRKLSFL